MFYSSNRKLIWLSNLDLIRILLFVLNPNVSKFFCFLSSTLWKCRAGFNVSKVVRSWHSSWWLSQTATVQSKLLIIFWINYLHLIYAGIQVPGQALLQSTFSTSSSSISLHKFYTPAKLDNWYPKMLLSTFAGAVLSLGKLYLHFPAPQAC